MELKTRIKLLGVKPKDAPSGVTANQFGKWLRAVLHDQYVSTVGLSFVTIVCELLECRNRKTDSLAEIFHQTEKPGAPADPREFGAFIARGSKKTKEVKKDTPPIAAKNYKQVVNTTVRTFTESENRTLKLKPTGVNTMDPPMTKKLRTVGTDCFWFLYGTKNKYKFSEKDQDCILDLEEGIFTINDFETR